MALFGKQLTLYSGPPARPARVAQFQLDTAGSAGTAAAKGDQADGKYNFNSVLLLIPGEVVAPYITGSGLPIDTIGGYSWKAVVFYVCLLTCILLRGQASKPAGASGLRGVNVRLVIVSAIAFFLWAHAVSDNGPIIGRSVFVGLPATMSPGCIWGFFAVIFGLLAPMFVPAVRPQP
ncbi:MAG TPA: hypothetical protein VHB27_03655 [Rhodopila sp.]|uniref:hypothetical protein n=1 Tax=Rhodopila sp. TaxID=2480087 RepID=UPI002CE6510E|nr:hypothetical protein [Rhodopila sp.]HVY14297.1 hypothetical protein [Rhodopila sp.]